MLHFLTLILILHSRSQFAFYEDLRNKSLHPTAFCFLSNQFGKSSVPRCFFLGFGVSGGSSEGNPGNIDRGGSLHVSVIGIGLVSGRCFVRGLCDWDWSAGMVQRFDIRIGDTESWRKSISECQPFFIGISQSSF